VCSHGGFDPFVFVGELRINKTSYQFSDGSSQNFRSNSFAQQSESIAFVHEAGPESGILPDAGRSFIAWLVKKVHTANSASTTASAEIFTIRELRWFGAMFHGSSGEASENPSSMRHARPRSLQVAQDLQHMAVDGLHSIDFSADRRTAFLLTLKMKGVKTMSFFDSF
jgi:hypothetical protein